MIPDDSDLRDGYPWRRAMPCPECSSTKGYSRVGKYRSQCLNCNALLKNAEINQEDREPQ